MLFKRFIAEEESSVSGEKILTRDPTWIIDPIDGTTNFVKKLHLVCISVAFVVDGEIQLAFLSNPTINELFTAKKGQGAFLNGERIEASKNETLDRCVLAHEIALGSLATVRPKILAVTEILMARTLGLRAFGSAALTLGYVAKGAVDVNT